MSEAIGRFIDEHPWMTLWIVLSGMYFAAQVVNNVGQSVANAFRREKGGGVKKIEE